MKRLVVAITGASGVIYGIRLLELLHAGRGDAGAVETHLVMSAAGRATVAQETDWKISDVEALAHVVHDPRDIGASIASGSFATAGMAIVPCSIKTLSHVATCDSGDLVSRAADVTLKEGRTLVLVVRETPFHLGHLRLMAQAAEAGAVIMPPMPAFYGRPQTLDEVIDGTVGRILLRLGIDNESYTRWNGMRKVKG
jgi:4-hydroxy-3-polyprenylbenzoate decarboxylase